MRILVVTPFPAYPDASGGGTAVFNLIRNLALRHEILYLSFARQEDMSHLAEVRQYCADMITVALPGGTGISSWENLRYIILRGVHNLLSFMTLIPVPVWKCRKRVMREALRQAIVRYEPDVVHLCFPQMAQYVTECGGVPAVMDTQDVATLSARRRAENVSNKAAKAYYYLQWLFWRSYEKKYYRMFGKVLTLTSRDGAAVKEMNPRLDVYAGAIGFDVWLPPSSDGQKGAHRIGFLANFAHQPNVDASLFFVEKILPLIRMRLADAEFVIAGRNPPLALCDSEMEGIKCIGFVQDAAMFYSCIDVIVAPLRHGGGIKIKVLEAMACGKAVVTTSIGAEGISEAGEGALVVEDEPAMFAEAVVELLEDSDKRTALGKQARQLVQQRFSWRRVMHDLDGIYGRLAGERR